MMGFVLYGLMRDERGTVGSFRDILSESEPAEVAETDLRQFKSVERPELQRLLDGKPTEEEWKQSLRSGIYARIHYRELITQSIEPYTIAWMIFGLITAFKIAHNKSETEDV
jgi:hypothetical protein